MTAGTALPGGAGLSVVGPAVMGLVVVRVAVVVRMPVVMTVPVVLVLSVVTMAGRVGRAIGWA